jgi:DNA-directed RNA polymerase specialized sigma24 family protein
LTKLGGEDEEGHRLVLLRYYAGLSLPEISRVLGVSLRTAERRWRFLRVWLQRELETEM